MRISVNARLLHESYHTGIQNYISNLYGALKVLYQENEYTFLDNPGSKSILENILFDNLLIRRHIKNSKTDVFHSPSIVLPFGEKICPYLVTVHDLGFKKFPSLVRKLDIAYYNFVFKNLVRKADLIITDSWTIRSEFQKYYQVDESRLRVIPLGVDDFYFRKEEKEYLDKVRIKYHLAGRKIILTNSAHSVRKNISSLVEACQSIPDCLLVVAGVIGRIGPRPNQPENVIWLGYLPKRELRALYQIANLFVYPSIYEGFGLPLLEAMASGTPVLASNIPAFCEILSNDNFLFDPLKVSEINEKIRANLNLGDIQKQVLFDYYQNILNRFTWSRTAKEMARLFNSFKK